MTNDQAKALAEKVWPNVGWVEYRSYALERFRYSVAKDNGPIFFGLDFESAFLAAGVKVCKNCGGTGRIEDATAVKGYYGCVVCHGLGYTLVGGEK